MSISSALFIGLDVHKETTDVTYCIDNQEMHLVSMETSHQYSFYQQTYQKVQRLGYSSLRGL